MIQITVCHIGLGQLTSTGQYLTLMYELDTLEQIPIINRSATTYYAATLLVMDIFIHQVASGSNYNLRPYARSNLIFLDF